jgi:hypothetical protein
MASATALVYWWSYRRTSRKASEALAEINPLKFSLDGDGLHLTQKTGVTVFQPWSGFQGFREGKTIFLLQRGAAGPEAVLKGGLDPDQVEALRAALRSHLTEIG